MSGDEEGVARLLRDEPSGLADERRDYLVAQASATGRDRKLTTELRELYAGTCQLCGWAPRRTYGTDLCEAHHVHWLSRGRRGRASQPSAGLPQPSPCHPPS